MADMTFRQKKMKSAAGPHNLQRDDHSGNEYEQMHGANEFFVVGDSYGSKPKNRNKPGDQTTPALNKDAGYNLGESISEAEAPAWTKRLKREFDPQQEIEEPVLNLMSFLGVNVDALQDRARAAQVVGKIKKLAYKVFQIDESDLSDEEKIVAMQKEGISPPAELPIQAHSRWYEGMMDLAFQTIGKTRYGR